jgi:signal transduction histidine kinase
MEENHVYLKDLIYNLSHQLKTPISSIKIFNEIMISEGDFKENQTKEFLLKTKKQINKVEWIIKKMFEISKIENNEMSFKKEKVRLAPIIEEIKDNYKHLIEEKQLEVIVDNKNDPEILIDKNMIKEGISNVIENAFKYSFPKEKVIIKFSEKNDKILLSIKDKGIKIEGNIELLFNKFYRGSEAKKTSPEGTGLGLAFTKAIIEKNNGEIQVFSEDENTEFIIKFQK